MPADEPDISLIEQAGKWITLTSSLREHGAIPDPAYWEGLKSQVLSCRFDSKAGMEICRARVMPLDREEDSDPLRPDEMGPPPAAITKPGRLKRSGSPRFYGALAPATTIAEVRPWKRARITVATFTSPTGLSLVDLTGRYTKGKGVAALSWLSFMLARPVHDQDEETYLPSQLLGDECETAGLDGILYDSALHSGGINLVLFTWDQLVCHKRALHEVTKLSYTTATLVPDDA
jgi:hypothetical protein